MVGFPGLGIGEFALRPSVFEGGSFLHWYGLIIAAGFLAAVLYCIRLSKSFKISGDEITDMLLWAVPSGIIGARLLSVIFNWSLYSSEPVSVLYIWEGGLAVYGAIIGACTACVLFCRSRKIHPGAMLDLTAFGLLLGQAIGRWGNFVNIELYGTETSLPWRMSVNGTDVHPLFLYESLWNIAGFALLHIFLKNRRFNGQIFTAYVAWYGLGRGLLEGLRPDEFSLTAGGLPAMQVLAFASLAGALIYLIVMLSKSQPPSLYGWTNARDEFLVIRQAGKDGLPFSPPDYDGIDFSQGDHEDLESDGQGPLDDPLEEFQQKSLLDEAEDSSDGNFFAGEHEKGSGEG
ncbi:MAG: prolipoprotein diacylglyceryl transferase [Oscillospiraceae bacterium]|nr:prolipoprotein diacylglyceryl transferase [Oscillospiraceae bacterium]